MTGTDLPDEQWHKSSHSDGQANCVEVAISNDQVAARDSKDKRGAALSFKASEWDAFIRGVNSGDFEQF